MVVKEIIHICAAVLTKLILNGMSDLKIVPVVVGGIDPLVALIVCNAVEHITVSPAIVLTVDYLAHEPEVLTETPCKAVDLADEIVCETVCSVEADTVNAPFFYPHFYSSEDVVYNLAVPEVQLYKVIVTVPALVGEVVAVWRPSAEIHSREPVLVAGALTVLLQILESKMISSHMIENTVQNDPDAVFVKLLADLSEFLIGSQTLVYSIVIRSVIAMLKGLKDRSELHSIHVQLFKMWDPFDYFEDPSLFKILSLRTKLFTSAEANRINMVYTCLFYPV